MIKFKYKKIASENNVGFSSQSNYISMFLSLRVVHGFMLNQTLLCCKRFIALVTL